MDAYDDNDLFDSFSTESLDMLDEVEPIFIALTNASDRRMDPEAVGSAFRLYHSIKGAASFLGFSNIAGITHAAETLLDRLRNGTIDISELFVKVQLETIDLLREILQQVRQVRNDHGHEDIRGRMVARIESVMHDEPAQAIPAAPPEEPDPPPDDFLPEFVVTDEMRQRFGQESADVLEEAEQALLALEKASEEQRIVLVGEAFRHLHSFKGNCGFMQLGDMEKLSHTMENVLGAMRDGQIGPDERTISFLLKSLDLLKSTLAQLTGGGTGAIPGGRALVKFFDETVLSKIEQGEAPPPAEPMASAEEPTPAPPPPEKPEPPSAREPEAIGSIADRRESVPVPAARRDIRVDVDKLDALINLVGELIIAEAMVLRNSSLLAIEDEQLERGIHQLKRVSSELQDVAMSVRMVPLATTFRRMIRLVHDTARKSSKQVGLQLIGEETEVDKNVIEQIGDPLVHIIRNSIDHGIEPPSERTALGKPSEGQVEIEARHEGGEVWIIVRDDGRGLNREKILAKANERGLFTGGDISDEDVYGFIFHPGFSTADKVTDVSGRGVGMDVVKKNIEKLNGKVRVKSNPGKGTEVVLRIPLTMAIIDGMLVRVGDSQYTLPLLSIRECIYMLNQENITITPDGRESVLVRGELIPVLRLHQLFNKRDAETDLSKGILVVVHSEDGPIALLVDELLGQQETVIKGLSSYLGSARGFSGCTVLGNGEVSLIVDIAGLSRMAMGTR